MLPEQRSYSTQNAPSPQYSSSPLLPATQASSLDGATSMTVGVYWKGLDGNRWIKDASGTRNLGSYTTGADTYWNNNGYTAINDPINAQFINGIKDNTYGSYSTYPTGTGSSAPATSAPAPSAADEQAAYDDQINNINKLLGYTATQKEQGLASLQSGFDDETRKLGDAKTKTMAGYDDQNVENSQNKQRGVEDVDQYANSSYNNLQRLLQGSHAGNSSVGRELVPYLISKSAGTRRQGVLDTAGKNEQAIVKARAYRRQNQKNS